MILNSQYKFLFVHVPKTAGQSLWRLFPRTKKEHKFYRTHIHAPYFWLKERDIPEDYFSFGFVRNPWDRLVSLYSFSCQKTIGPNDPFDQEEVKAMGFEKWLYEYDSRMKVDSQYADDVPRFQERDQFWWVDGCDFIGKFERLYEDAIYIHETVGMPIGEFIHINESKHKDYREYYTPAMVDFVSRHHKRTIESMGYDFENIHRF